VTGKKADERKKKRAIKMRTRPSQSLVCCFVVLRGFFLRFESVTRENARTRDKKTTKAFGREEEKKSEKFNTFRSSEKMISLKSKSS